MERQEQPHGRDSHVPPPSAQGRRVTPSDMGWAGGLWAMPSSSPKGTGPGDSVQRKKSGRVR